MELGVLVGLLENNTSERKGGLGRGRPSDGDRSLSDGLCQLTLELLSKGCLVEESRVGGGV